MKTTARMAVLGATLALVTGCTGNHLRHNREKLGREPVQLPTAPTLERSGAAPAGAAAPSPAPLSPFGANMQDASPSPLTSTQPAGR
ncbi:hypothetical protein OJF2_42750 [Aquisphaera giovannonii]|uniref:Lipoprotein n=1 Tax=Aquisphaera giovannonii TaxID=406548 RepID=A0A5B9W580_9BACT|nr:hypothetical protein [Aquisphaera giovannonii]QEH35718.1 hypothetical protein OJF2_42750 [Aquisphaera giovannonii]